MKNILKTLIISASFLTLFLPSAFCEKIIFSANSMSGTVGDKSDSTTLSGEAYVLTESMEISADKRLTTLQKLRVVIPKTGKIAIK